MKWLVLLLLLPTVAGQVVTAELGFHRELEPRKFTMQEGGTIGPNLCNGGELSIDPEKGEFFVFSESSDEQGCGTAIQNIPSPQDTPRATLRFLADRSVTGQVDNLDYNFQQQVRVQTTLSDSTIDYYPPDAGNAAPTHHEIPLSFQGTNLQISWIFRDAGAPITPAVSVLPSFNAHSAKIALPTIDFEGIPIATQESQSTRAISGNQENFVTVRVEIEPQVNIEDKPFIDLQFDPTYVLRTARGPNDIQFSGAQLATMPVDTGNIRIPVELIEEYGYGEYVIELSSLTYTPATAYLGPLLVMGILFPLVGMLLSGQEYRDHARYDERASALPTLWVGVAALTAFTIVWIILSGAIQTMIYFPPTLETILYYAVLFGLGIGFFLILYLWKRQRLVRTLDEEIVLRRRAQEKLERSNDDLELFAYVASHDMKEPLRMVKFYTQRLKKRYSGKLDADADEFIDYAADNAERMENLLQGLLEYSRLDSAGEMTSLGVEELVRAVESNLHLLIDENKAKIVTKNLGEIKGNRTQILQLLQNLIENAIKYRSKKAPRIEIGQNGNTLTVRDNGRGIPPKHRTRVFQLFKQLTKEVGGNGIGLALCKRIVEKHKGTIVIEDNEGGGTQFIITLHS